MTNYIGKVDAEWVDPAVELPEEGWYTVRWHSGQVARSSFDGQKWGYPSVSAWLRIGGPSTDIPRAKVQAAVDEMVKLNQLGKICINGESRGCEGCALAMYPVQLCRSLACIAHHTGITPTTEAQQ